MSAYPFQVGDQFMLNGAPFVLAYINEGKRRFTLTPLPAKPPAMDQRGAFIDPAHLNGDPVWVVYKSPANEWLATHKPQSIFEFAYGDKISIAGEDPYLYGFRFVDREDIFTSREAAEDECARRNASVSAAG